MSDFASASDPLAAAPPEPNKHVNYTLGMVLGVDDFTQDFAYIIGRDQWALRDVIGYGTLCGLQVKIDLEESTPRVLVMEGVALSPRGQLIQVTPAQCLRLNAWLAANRPAVIQQVGSPAGAELPVYVTLCYDHCPVDDVPIPGEPCRTVSESMAPSRILDSFTLELRFTPPDQVEEDAVRDFVGWLSQVEVSDAPGAADLDEFLDAVRGAAQGLSSPLASPPDFMAGSPWAALHIHPADACEFWRAAFRIWVTELRPYWIGNKCGLGPQEKCLLLAELRLPLAVSLAGDLIVDGGWDQRVYEERRPYVLHLRMLQEWLLCGRSPMTVMGSPIDGGPALVPATAATPETGFGQAANAGIASTYSRGDHTHGTPPDPIPAHKAAPDAHQLAGDVTGDIGVTKVERLQGVNVAPTAPAADQVLRFTAGAWTPVDLLPGAVGPLAGDVTGDIGVTKVERLQGVNVAPTAPAADQVLRFTAGAWTPVTLPPPAVGPLAGDVTGAIGVTKVERLQGVNVAPTAPAADQVLRFTGGAWRPVTLPPATGNFVEHPAAPGSFSIVAAGVVRGDGSSRTPNYANLVAQTAGPGELQVIFDGYQQPQDDFLFIVKALAVFDVERRQKLDNRPPIITFDRFDADGVGFFLYVSWDNTPMEEGMLKEQEVMIEVSMYPSKIA